MLNNTSRFAAFCGCLIVQQDTRTIYIYICVCVGAFVCGSIFEALLYRLQPAASVGHLNINAPKLVTVIFRSYSVSTIHPYQMVDQVVRSKYLKSPEAKRRQAKYDFLSQLYIYVYLAVIVWYVSWGEGLTHCRPGKYISPHVSYLSGP